MKIRSSRTRLTDILTKAGLVDGDGVERALERQRMQPGRMGSQLLKLGLVGEEDLAKALSLQFSVPPFLASLCEVDPFALQKLPRAVAKRCRALPFQWDAHRSVLYVAMTDPQNLRAVDEVRFASGARKVVVHVAPETVLERLLTRHYEGVEVPSAPSSELSIGSIGAPAAAGAKASSASPKAKPAVLVADPDPRRRRAVAGLLESSGFRVTRATTADEAIALFAREPWPTVWVHRDWRETAKDVPNLRVYGDPVEALVEATGPVETLRREALEIAETAAAGLLEDRVSAARKAVSLVRFLGARRGIEGLTADCLALRAWRTALRGWERDGTRQEIQGSEIVDAVATYEKALLSGCTAGEAAAALRADASLDSGAVTSLIRWAVGEDLLSRFEAAPRLLLVARPDRAQRLFAHLAGSGWEITIAEAEPAKEVVDDSWDAILSEMGPGLPLLDHNARLSQEKRPPTFLLADDPNAPDTMYALKLGAEDVLSFDTHPEVLETKLRRSVSRRSPRRGFVTGNLRDMGLADILQILSNGAKTAVLRVNGPAGPGEVALENGSIVDARVGTVEGEEALYSLIGWEEGDFQIVPGRAARAATVSGSTEGLLMEGFRRLDEERRGTCSEDLPKV